MGERTGRTCLTWQRQGLGRDLEARCASNEKPCAVCVREAELEAIEKRAAMASTPISGGGHRDDMSESAKIISLSEQVVEVSADRDRLTAENAELRRVLTDVLPFLSDCRCGDPKRCEKCALLRRRRDVLNAK